MAILNQKRILNLIPKTSAPVTIHVSQGDVGTEIEFTLVKGDEVFVNPGNISASVHGVREDRANFGPFTCTLSGSKVIFSLHSEMTAVKGSAIAEVVLVDNGGNKVGSANFGILVEQSVFPLGVTYDNDVSVYESILTYAQQMNAIISNEISERTSADAFINTRIDEIIAPTGEAPNPAEITDARIDVDNITHTNLGGAVRNQVSNVKSMINYSTTKHLMIETGTFSDIPVGGVTSKEPNTKRFRNSFFIPIKWFKKISIDSPYEIFVSVLNEANQLVAKLTSTWSSSVDIEPSWYDSNRKYLTLVIRNSNTPNTDISSQLEAVNASLHVDMNYEDSQEISEKISLGIVNSLMLESGSFTDTSIGEPGFIKIYRNSRIRNAFAIPFDMFMRITIPEPYQLFIALYDENMIFLGSANNGQWTNDYSIDMMSRYEGSAKYLSLVIRNSNTPYADISDELDTVNTLIHTEINRTTPKVVDQKIVYGVKNLIDNSESIKDLSDAPYNESTATIFYSTEVNGNYDGERIFAMSGPKYIEIAFPNLEIGEKYTFSIDISREYDSQQNAYLVIGENTYSFIAPQNEWNRASVSFIADENTTSVKVFMTSTDPTYGPNWMGCVRKACLSRGINNEWLLSDNDKEYRNTLNILKIHHTPTRGQLNAIKRARQLTDFRWKPIENLTRISHQGNDSGNEDGKVFEDFFLKNEEYYGAPYSETNHVRDYGYNRKAHIGETIGIETFVTSVRNPNSAVMQESEYRQGEHSACLYGCVCSNLTSYALGLRTVHTSSYLNIPGMVNKGKLSTVGADAIDLCDVLLIAGFHVAIVTDIIRDDSHKITFVEISEATWTGNDDNSKAKTNDGGGDKWGGKCRRKWWNVDELMDVWGNYYIVEYTKKNEIKYTPNIVVPMLDEVDTDFNPNLPCMPYMGNKFIYKKDQIPNSNILVSSIGYNSLVVKKDGTKWNSDGTTNPYVISSDAVEVGFTAAGNYEAYLADIDTQTGIEKNRTGSCKWRVSSAETSIQISNGIASFTCIMPDGFDKPVDVILNSNLSYPLTPWIHLVDSDITITDLSGGRKEITFSVDAGSIVSGYYQIAFENEYGCWHTDAIAY